MVDIGSKIKGPCQRQGVRRGGIMLSARAQSRTEGPWENSPFSLPAGVCSQFTCWGQACGAWRAAEKHPGGFALCLAPVPRT